MQIKQAHIINFGKLSDKTYDFDAGVNQIFERNGYGKTTLMAFIKAMLYGYTNKQKAEREHYSPWNMGIYGGNLVVEQNGTEYRIERTFGATQSKDTLKVYNNKTLELLDINEVGTEFLGLDEQSFLYTTYINEDMLNGSANSNLISKLTQLNKQGQQDLTNYDRAIKKLEEAKKNIKNARGGKINAKQEELAQINRLIENAVNAQNNYDEKVEQIAFLSKKATDLEKVLSEIDDKIELASKNEGAQKSRQAFTSLSEKQQQTKQDLAQKMLVFPLGLPDEASIQMCQEKIVELKQSKNTLNELNAECEKEKEQKDFEAKYAKSQQIISNQNTTTVAPAKNKKPHIIGASISTCLFVLSVVVMLLLNLYAGIALLALSAIYLVFSIIKLTSHSKEKTIDNTLPNLNALWGKEFNSIADFYDFASIKKAELSNTQKALNQRAKEQENLDKLQSDITMFFSNFNITYTNFDSAIKDLQLKILEIKKLDATLAQITEQLELFDTSSLTQNENLDINKLKASKEQTFAELTQTNKQIAEYKSQKETFMAQAEKYQELTQKAQEIQEELDYLNDRFIKINYALIYLTKAKQQLGDKYILPTQEKLNALALEFDKTSAYTPIKIKDDLTLVYEQNGVLRSEDTLSSGLRHAFNLLYRFALAQTIYNGKDFCLFLDDAFATLDENNLNMLKEFVNKIAKENQIIYFTCSKERLIK